MRLETPIKSCGECGRSYTLTEWRGLEPGVHHGTVELRTCECGSELVLDVEGLEELELTDTLDAYAKAFPHSPRPRAAAEAALVSVAARTDPSPAPGANDLPRVILSGLLRTMYRTDLHRLGGAVKSWPAQVDRLTLADLRAELQRLIG